MKKTFAAMVAVATIAGSLAATPASAQRGVAAGVAAGVFTAGGPTSLVTINPGTETIGLVAGLGNGRFANPVTLNGAVLLLLAGVVMGYMTHLARGAEQRLQRATEVEASNRERERLARSIHDSVLQVLALVERRGAELGGEAA